MSNSLDVQTAETKNEELVQFTEEGVFTIAKVWNDNLSKDEYFVLFGKYRFNDKAIDSLENAMKFCKEITFEKIVNLIGIFMAEKENINLKPEIND